MDASKLSDLIHLFTGKSYFLGLTVSHSRAGTVYPVPGTPTAPQRAGQAWRLWFGERACGVQGQDAGSKPRLCHLVKLLVCASVSSLVSVSNGRTHPIGSLEGTYNESV